LISHLKLKHRIYESEDHKTIRAQEAIRSQIVINDMSLFEATKQGSNNLKKMDQLPSVELYHTLITSVEPEWAFSATGLFVTNSETD